MRDGVEGVGDRDDARCERDPSPLQLARVAPAIPSFVMGEDALFQFGIEAREGLQHVGTATRMRGDGAPFGGREALHIVDDVEERLVDLADVVEERDTRDAATLTIREIGRFAEDECVFRDAPDMEAGIGIVGIDGPEERFECGGSHPLGGLARLELVPDDCGAGGGSDAGGGDG